jgi:hypothetical protein
VSASTRTISITNASATENVSVVVPSELDAQGWTDLLNETGDYDPSADPNDGAYVYNVRDRPNGVELYFEPDTTHQLKLSKVGVGQGVEGTEPAYLTSAEDLTSNPFVDRTYPFAVEARDKYNNPIGTSVTAAADRGTVPSGVVVEPGRYRYRYFTPSATGTDTVNLTYQVGTGDPVYDTGGSSFDGTLPENVQYGVDVQSAAGGGGGGANTPTITINQFDITDDSNNNKIKIDIVNITATDSDGDDDLQQLEVELIDANSNVLDSTSATSPSGASVEIVGENNAFNVNRGTNPHVVRVTVTDADGNTEQQEQNVG